MVRGRFYVEHCFRSDRTNGILLQPNNWKLRHRWTVYLFVVAMRSVPMIDGTGAAEKPWESIAKNMV